jgi:two-component system chemotaxis response regulator CheB
VAVRSLDAVRLTDQVIAIGASTGGTEAIAEVLRGLPPDAPGVVIVQHIPPSSAAASRRASIATARCRCARPRTATRGLVGHAYIAPGDRHLRIVRSGARWQCRLARAAGQRPPPERRRAVRVGGQHAGKQRDRRAADRHGRRRRRGLGRDARGRRDDDRPGSRDSSVVWGMPGEAVKRGAASEVVPLGDVAGRLVTLNRRAA